MKKHFGWPQLGRSVVAVTALMSLSAFILAIVSTSAPAWITFYDRSGNFYGIGLFNACKNNICEYAWNSQLLPSQYTNMTNISYSSSTPQLISTAQGFFVTGIFTNLLAFCWWAGGSFVAAVTLFFPALFYTIGFGCAESFFIKNEGMLTSYIHSGSFGYAAACGAACLILVWLAFFGFLADGFFGMSQSDDGEELESSGNSDPEIALKETNSQPQSQEQSMTDSVETNVE